MRREVDRMKGKLLGIALVLLLAVQTVPVTAINLNPSNATVGTEVEVQLNASYDPCGSVTVFFNGQPQFTNDSVDCNVLSYVTIGKFKVPNVPIGNYSVKADNGTSNNTTLLYVVPAAQEKSLAELGITSFQLNETVRYGESFRIIIGVNSSIVGRMNITLALVNNTNWGWIKTNLIDKSLALYNTTILSNATPPYGVNKSIGGETVWNVTVAGNLSNETYYVVFFNTTTLNNTVDLYNVSATVRVIPPAVPKSLENMGINESWWGNTTKNVTEGGVAKIYINASMPVNIAIVKNETWQSLHGNISVLKKDKIFAEALWYKENFKNNKNETLTVSVPVSAVGEYRIVVFNTTDYDYVYYYNCSTMLNVTPYPKSATLSFLGVSEVSLNKTEMKAIGDAIEMYISGVTKCVHVAVVNSSIYDWMKGAIDSKLNMTNESLAVNATRYLEICSPDLTILSGIHPGVYYVVVYNNTSVADREWINYYNVAKNFAVYYPPRSVPLSSLNITKLEVNGTSFSYGSTIGLTVNVTGSANFNIVIIREDEWEELKAEPGIFNTTLIGNRWNSISITGNNTWPIPTLGTLYPASYVVVAYNNTTQDYVDYYNDSVRFTVNPIAQKVSLDALGVVVLDLDKEVARVGENITLSANFTRELKVVVMNETNWTTVITRYPNDNDARNYAATMYNSVVQNNWTINGSRIIEFNVSSPDRYIVIVYENVSGAIGKYNDDIRFQVIVAAQSRNLTDLVDYFSVDPRSVKQGESVTISLRPNSTKLVHTNVAILNKSDWDQIRGVSISKSAIISRALWSKINVSTDLVEKVTMTTPGTFVVLVYNNSSQFYDYVQLYNDSTTVEVTPLAQPDLTVEIAPVTAVLGKPVNVTVTVKNLGNATAEAFKVAFYVNDEKKEEKNVSSLAAGANTTLTFIWTPQAAENYTLKAVVDPDDNVKESDEENNEASTTVEVIAAEPWQSYDGNNDGKIDTNELINAIQDWLENKLSTNDLIEVIQKWLER
uniref:EF-hand domain-containing protein n=1 Tax=Archaeoglobus fulgidus TaxID=2234 RepID=A0A7C3MAC9_ARCFL